MLNERGAYTKCQSSCWKPLARELSALLSHSIDTLVQELRGWPQHCPKCSGQTLIGEFPQILEVSASITAENGAVKYAVAPHDITERKRYEAQIAARAAELLQKNFKIEGL